MSLIQCTFQKIFFLEIRNCFDNLSNSGYKGCPYKVGAIKTIVLTWKIWTFSNQHSWYYWEWKKACTTSFKQSCSIASFPWLRGSSFQIYFFNWWDSLDANNSISCVSNLRHILGKICELRFWRIHPSPSLLGLFWDVIEMFLLNKCIQVSLEILIISKFLVPIYNVYLKVNCCVFMGFFL